jgi:IS66 Orf2 like protein
VARHFSRQTRSVLGQPFPRWLVAIDAFGPRTQQERVVTAPRLTLSVPKRLENGKFKWPTRDAASIELTEHELALLLDGVDFTHIRRTDHGVTYFFFGACLIKYRRGQRCKLPACVEGVMQRGTVNAKHLAAAG